jgi:hypothetical protein
VDELSITIRDLIARWPTVSIADSPDIAKLAVAKHPKVGLQLAEHLTREIIIHRALSVPRVAKP